MILIRRGFQVVSYTSDDMDDEAPEYIEKNPNYSSLQTKFLEDFDGDYYESLSSDSCGSYEIVFFREKKYAIEFGKLSPWVRGEADLIEECYFADLSDFFYGVDDPDASIDKEELGKIADSQYQIVNFIRDTYFLIAPPTKKGRKAIKSLIMEIYDKVLG